MFPLVFLSFLPLRLLHRLLVLLHRLLTERWLQRPCVRGDDGPAGVREREGGTRDAKVDFDNARPQQVRPSVPTLPSTPRSRRLLIHFHHLITSSIAFHHALILLAEK